MELQKFEFENKVVQLVFSFDFLKLELFMHGYLKAIVGISLYSYP
jgi:hypothetical protein